MVFCIEVCRSLNLSILMLLENFKDFVDACFIP